MITDRGRAYLAGSSTPTTWKTTRMHSIKQYFLFWL